MSTPTLEREWPPAGARPAVPPSRATRPGPGTTRRERQIPLSVLAGLATLGTTLCLGNLFSGVRWWLIPAAGAIAVAVVAGEAGRRLRLPMLAMPVVYAVLGWLYVIPVAALGTHEGPQISLLPYGTTLSGLRALAQSGSHDIHNLTVPVPDRPGFLFLTVAGVYLVAVLVDSIAAGLHRPAAAGLPLLVLLAVPAAVVQRGIGLLAFLAAATGYVALLLASGRRGLVGWARLPPGGATRVLSVTGAAGRRIGGAALITSVVLGVIVPRYTGIGHRHGGGGSDTATVVEPVVTLSQQLHSDVVEPLLSVRTNAPEYLRLTALESFDGTRFTLEPLTARANARVSHGLPAPVKGTAEQVQATVTIEPVLHQHYLPLPYQPTKISVGGDWLLDSRTATVFSTKSDTSGAGYTVTAEVATPSAETLQSQSIVSAPMSANIAADTALPPDLPASIGDLEARITSGLTNDYDKVAAIQAYLRGPLFTYDLNGAPTSGDNALVDFLFTDHRGYCEQFAGAMAVLVREARIPARVAVGFTPGALQADGSYLITNHDAHSWPEVWFPQSGWIRFEPTKRDASTTPPAYTVPPSGATATPTPTASASPTPSATASAAPAPPRHDRASAAPSAAQTPGGSGGFPIAAVGWVAGILAALVLALTPAYVRRRRRGRRLRSGSAHDIWDEVMDTAADLGFPTEPTLTPHRLVQFWTKRPPADGRLPSGSVDALHAAALAEELARYGPTAVQAADETADVLAALINWERSCIARDRTRAVLLPRSVFTAAASSGREGIAQLRLRSKRRFRPV